MSEYKLEQVCLPYYLWEEWKAGMWKTIDGQEKMRLLKDAIKFTGNAKLYGKYMRLAVKKWPNSCLNTLTNSSMNHRAWVGHAATCIALNCPEDITRLAWHSLTQKQQDDANAQADNAIQMWFNNYQRGIQLCLNIG